MADRICVPLWAEAGLGGPGEEGVLLDSTAIGYQYPVLFPVETNEILNTPTW